MHTIRTYILGFVLSTALTIAAFVAVGEHLRTEHLSPSHEVLAPLIVALALLQFGVQALFFLRLREESSPRWNLSAFCFALVVVVILVGGTLWIMSNLPHARVDTDAEQIFHDENIFPTH